MDALLARIIISVAILNAVRNAAVKRLAAIAEFIDMMESIESGVLEIILKFTASRCKIDDSTSINLDLSIDGDDAFELLEEIQKKFGTKFEKLDWRLYFYDEPTASIANFLKLLGYRGKRRSLSVGKLIEVVRQGEWFED